MKKIILTLVVMAMALGTFAQKAKVYDETIDPDVQIVEAVAKAQKDGKFVVAQLGGNWCKWCIRFARFVDGDPELKKYVDDNFEFIHVNYNPRSEDSSIDKAATEKALRRLGNPVRFGYPVLVVLDSEGNVLHTQDSGLLESGDGYDKEKVMRFFELWSPSAVEGAR